MSNNLKIPNASITIGNAEPTQKPVTKSVTKCSDLFHDSVKNVLKIYPKIKVPQIFLYINISPCVRMPMNEVETYFKQHNRSMQENVFCALQALRLESNKIADSSNSDEVKKNIENNLSIEVCDNYTKVVKVHSADKLKTDLKIIVSSNDSTLDCSSPSSSKKIKLSEPISSSEKKRSSALEPVQVYKSKVETQGPVQIFCNEKKLHICNICNSVHYYLKDLKRHQLKHLRCQFCKIKLKTMDLKEEHIRKQCSIKKVMNSLPNIKLTKVENILAIRQKYPDVFRRFAPIPSLPIDKGCPENKKNSKVTSHVKAKNSIDDVVGVIEIPSDEEAKEVASTSTISSKTFLTSTNDLGVQNDLTMDYLPNLSSSIIKPDIRIKNNNIFDTIDPKHTDVMVLKELLKNYSKIQLTKDIATQPEPPLNTSVKMNPHDSTAILKNLMDHLLIYTVPIDVKYGTYNITFDYNHKQKKAKKKGLWSHLRAINLKKPISKTFTKNKSSLNNQTLISNPTNRPHVLTDCNSNSVCKTWSQDKLAGKSGNYSPQLTDILHPSDRKQVSSDYKGTLAPKVSSQSNNNSQRLSRKVPASSRPSCNGLKKKIPSSTVGKSVGPSYRSSGTNIVPETTSVTPPTPLLYQTNPASSVMLTTPSNYLSYEQSNIVYNGNTSSMMVSNSVSQVFVSSTPVLSSPSLLSSGPIPTIHVLSNSPVVQSSSTLNVSSLSHATSLPFTNVDCSTSFPSTAPVSIPSTFSVPTLLPSYLTTNQSSTNIVNFNSNVGRQHMLSKQDSCDDNPTRSSSSSVPPTQNSDPAKPLIRVKNLLELK